MRRFSPAIVLAALLATNASASPLDPGMNSGYSPRVPVSALATPISMIDPQQFHVSTMVSVGSYNKITQGLQVTSLSYQFKAPVELRVNIGNAWGPQVAGSNSFFLEGVDFSFRPSANTFFQVQYKDVRSPLQYDNSYFGYGPYWAR